MELTLAQGEALGGSLPRGLVAYGRLPLMLTRACPAANGPKGCLHCARTGPAPVLTDRRGARFPVDVYKRQGRCARRFPQCTVHL